MPLLTFGSAILAKIMLFVKIEFLNNFAPRDRAVLWSIKKAPYMELEAGDV
jgi:hypothetical protein